MLSPWWSRCLPRLRVGGGKWPDLLVASGVVRSWSRCLLTAPVSAVVGLLLVVGGLCIGMVGSLLPSGSPVAARALALARWPGDLEWWRISKARSRAGGERGMGQRPRSKETANAADPGLSAPAH